MAAPVVESSSTQVFANRAGSTTFTKPTGTANGDLLVLHYVIRANQLVTLPSGFTTEIDAFTNDGVVGNRAYVAYKVAGSSEPSSYTVTHTGTQGTIGALHRVSGADTTTPIDVSAETSGGTANFALDSPSVTTTVADCLILVGFLSYNFQGASLDITPSGATNVVDIDTRTAVAEDVQATAGATGAYDWAVSDDNDAVLTTIAIAPASGGTDALLADDTQATSEVSTPTLAEIVNVDLLADDVESASEVTNPALAEVVVEYLRPDSTVSAGSWETDLGVTTNLHLAVDETTASDSDYIRSETAPSASICQIGLSNPPTGVDTAEPVILRYRYRKSGIEAMNIVVRLKESTTTIASNTHNGVGASFVDGSITLSAPEKASVGSWADVYFEVEATQV